MSNIKIQGEVSLDTSNADAALTRVTTGASKMSAAVGKSGKEAADSIGKIGDGGAASAAKVEASTRNMIGAIQRTTAALEAGSKSGAEYYESLAKQRGVDVSVLRPYLAQLDAVKDKQEAAARSAEFASKAFLAIGAAIGIGAVGFVRMIDGAIEAADNMRDLSKTTGIAVEQLAGLQLAAKQSGGDLDGIAKSINKLSMNIGKDGDKFKALGISAKEPIEAFKQLSDIFSSIQDPQMRAALGAAALGKSWESAAPLLSEGSKSIGEMIEKGTRLSRMTGDMTDEADKFKDSMAELSAAASGLKMGLAGEMLPALNQITQTITLAYEESGKLSALWVAMGALGTFLYTDEFSSAKVKIQELQKEITKLEGYKKNTGLPFLTSWLYGTEAEWTARITEAKREISSLIDLTKPRVKDEVPKENSAQIAANKEFIRAQKEQSDASESAAKSAEKARESFIKSLEKEAETYGMTATQSKLYEASLLGIKGKQLDIVKSSLAKIESDKALEAASKRAAEGQRDIEKLYKSIADERKKSIASAESEADKNEELARTFGMTKTAIEEMQLARLEEQLAQRSNTAMTLDEIETLEKLIEAKKRSVAAISQIDTMDAAKKQFDDLSAESKKFTDGLYQGLSDALMRGFESGKGFFQTFWDSIKNLFKTTVLKMAVQGVVNGVTGAFTQGAASSLGSAAVGGGSSLGSTANLFSTGKTIYSGFEAAAATGTIGGGIGSLAGSAIGSIGGALGSSTLSAFGTGLAGTATGTFAGAGMTAAGSATGFGALAVEGTAATAAGAGSAITAGLAAIPVWGWIALAAIAAVKFGSGKDRVQTGSGISGSLGTDNLTRDVSWTKDGGWFNSNTAGTWNYNLANSTAMVDGKSYTDSANSSTDKEMLKNLNKAYDTLKINTADYAKALGINADSIADRTDAISFAFGATAEETTANITKMFADVGNKIASDLLGPFAALSKEGESSSSTLARLSINFSGVNDVMKALGLSTYKISVDGVAAANGLSELFGGIDKLKESAASYFDNFYTASEKLALSTVSVGTAFTDLHIAMPKTRAEFRAMVDAARAAGDDTLLASLLKLSPAFASITSPAEDFSAALLGINKGIESRIDSLVNAGLTQEQLRAKEMNGADESTKVLLKRLYALEDQKVAEDKLTESMRKNASERYGLETRWLQLTGDTNKLREREIALLDPSNQGLQRQIWAEEDRQKSMEESARASSEAASAAKQLASAWQSITNTLYDEVARIRGLTAGNSAQSLASAQAQFSIANVQALSGDQEAAKLLPKLSQTLLAIAEQQSPTLEALNRIRASTAGSLENTANSFSRFGATAPAQQATQAAPATYQAQAIYQPINLPQVSTAAANDTLVSSLIVEVREMKSTVEKLVSPAIETERNTRKMKDNIQRVTHDGEEMQTRVLA